MNASRNQRRFFSSIVAKCTSSNPDCTTPPPSCGPSWVICVELDINGISRTCPQGNERWPLCLHSLCCDGPGRPDTARRSFHCSHVQILFAIYIFGDPFPSVGEAIMRTKIPAGQTPAMRVLQPHQGGRLITLDTVCREKLLITEGEGKVPKA